MHWRKIIPFLFIASFLMLALVPSSVEFFCGQKTCGLCGQLGHHADKFSGFFLGIITSVSSAILLATFLSFSSSGKKSEENIGKSCKFLDVSLLLADPIKRAFSRGIIKNQIYL